MAIKANELRIGNYHKTSGLEIPRLNISSVKIEGQAYAAITAYGIYLVQDGKIEFEPIPITREWLLQLGGSNDVWQIMDAPMFPNEYGIERSFLSIEPSTGECCMFLKQKYSQAMDLHEIVKTYQAIEEDKRNFDLESFPLNFGSVHLQPIKYVHELQNLYFVLTGIELVVSSAAGSCGIKECRTNGGSQNCIGNGCQWGRNAPTEPLESEGEEKCVCGDCGEPLTLVRPGKYQCDNRLCQIASAGH